MARDRECLPFATLAEAGLPGVLRDNRVVRELGQRYRDTVPAEDDARLLAHAILANSHGASAASIRALVNEQVQRDFTGGRTVMVNGWILAVTEARQCALYSLLPA